MWFDAHAKLAEIATQAPAARPVSQVTQVSQPPEAQKPAFRVATVATPARSKPEPTRPNTADFPYGTACGLGLMPKTWTGRVVSLADWRNLSEWDRHGPNGRIWCGLCQGWHLPGDCEDGGVSPRRLAPFKNRWVEFSFFAFTEIKVETHPVPHARAHPRARDWVFRAD